LVLKSRTTTYPSFPHVATCTEEEEEEERGVFVSFLKFEGERTTFATVMPAECPNSNVGALAASTTRTTSDDDFGEEDMMIEYSLLFSLFLFREQQRTSLFLVWSLNCFVSNFLSTEQEKPKPSVREGKFVAFLGFLMRPLAAVFVVVVVVLLLLLLHLFPPLLSLHKKKKNERVFIVRDDDQQRSRDERHLLLFF
jgi:hypothetical protein